MRKVFAVTAALALLGFGIAAQADVFNLGAGYTNLETVTVGDPGNAADTRYATPGYGSVGYTYNIGKYEVTAAQYCDFLNAKAKVDTYGLYYFAMWDGLYGCKIQRSGASGTYTYSIAAGWANRPVNYVSYWDACRFANWLGNGQGDGDTETGAYTLNGYNGEDGRTIQRNGGAKWAVTSEDQWYKAAYYKGGGINAGYWDYPTQATSINTDMANYDLSVGQTTKVGSYAYSSAYGTFDQGGNVYEWNESILAYDSWRGLRGSSFHYSDTILLRAEYRGCSWFPSGEDYYIGFRVASVPEPSSILALTAGLISLLGIRRRKA